MPKIRRRQRRQRPVESEDESDHGELSMEPVSKEVKEEDRVDREERNANSVSNAREHCMQLKGLQEKDPEFYNFLKEHDKKLLEFDDDDMDDDSDNDMLDVEPQAVVEEVEKSSAKVITTEMVDSWCRKVKENGSLGAVRSLLRAFRTACHYGDDVDNDSSSKFSIMSSGVFNKIMVFVLNEMDAILRGLLKAPTSGGKKETILELTTTKIWKKYGNLMRLYLGNALHILTQMTDEQMISFTLKRVKATAVFLAAFPSLLRKYVKVSLHCWGTGRGALPVISFLFMRDLCIRLGSDYLDTCLKGIYKAYISNCKLAKSVSRSKIQHITFLGNCVTELYGLDPPSAYQHAFVFIRQLAMILHGAITEREPKVLQSKIKGKKPPEGGKSLKQKGDHKVYQKVYDWQFICCLELWTRVICSYNLEGDFRPLAYPLTQIISGVACLVPTARYIPLRLRCIRMLNHIARTTGTFIPVSSLLLCMLEMKELNRSPSGGIGKAVNFLGVKQVDKTTLKTRAFQEECIFSMIEELAEHLAQWSYSIAFIELAFIPLVRLRSFFKSTNVERFRKVTRELIIKVEENSEFINARRRRIDFSPNSPAVSSFMKSEKELLCSPLSKFVADLRVRSRQRADSTSEPSVLIGEKSSVFGSKLSKLEEESDDNGTEAAAVFSSSWLPQKKRPCEKAKASKKRHLREERDLPADEDVVEDLVLSSDDDEELRKNHSEHDKLQSEVSSLKQASTRKPRDSGYKQKRRESRRKRMKKVSAS